MADVTPILINQLAAQTTLADSDYFIVGGADAKKITVAQMKEALGINALNGNFQWKEITPIPDIPARQDVNISAALTNAAKEIHVVVQWTDGDVKRRQNFNLNISADLSDSTAYIVKGGYFNNDYYQFCELAVSRSKIRLNTLMYNGDSIASSAKIWITYR